MLAEAAHSVADTTNQVFLLVSLRTSRRAPDEEHPYGHGQDRFFWSFLVAVLIFFVGALFSIYHGVTALLHAGEESHESFLISYIVLGVAFVFEAAALNVSIREFRRAAREEGHPFFEYFGITRNTIMKVPLLRGHGGPHGARHRGPGALPYPGDGQRRLRRARLRRRRGRAAVVAWELGRDSRALLLGEAVLPEDRERIREAMLSFAEVTDVFRLLTMHLGPDSVLVNAEILVKDGLDTDQVEDLLERVTRKVREGTPEVTQTFIELHPAGRAG
jgi:divalent metal cation (Fe/Co/Zn/Cd) transporter